MPAPFSPISKALSLRLASAFAPDVRQRGYDYFVRKRVTIETIEPDFVIANVRGTHDYEVVLEIDESLLIAECSCPFATEQEELCKHIWATLLEADQRRFGRGSLAPSWIELRYDQDDHEFRHAPTPPSWRTKLQSLTAAPTRSPEAVEQWVIGYSLRPLPPRDLMLNVTYVRPRSKGGWTKPQPLRINASDFARLPSAEDRSVLAMLMAGRGGGWAPINADRLDFSAISLPAVALEYVLPLVCATGRLVLNAKGMESEPLRWNDAAPWRFVPRVVRDDVARAYRVEGMLQRGDEQLAANAPGLVHSVGLIVTGAELSRLDDGGLFPLLAQLRESGPIAVPLEDGEELVTLLSGVAHAIDVPEELRWEDVAVAPKPLFRLRRGPWPNDPFFGEVHFDYGGTAVHESASQQRVALSARRFAIRERGAERDAVSQLQPIGITRSHDGWKVPPSRLLDVIGSLLANGWHVESEGSRYRRSDGLSLRIASGIDWFELRGEARFEDQTVAISGLLEALERGEQTITLDDGSIAIVDTSLREQLPLLSFGARKGASVRFSRSQLSLVDALLAARPEIAADEQIEQARSQLRRFDGVAPREAPAGFHGHLRDYQKDGLGWFHFLEDFGFGGCLADDMGLGKTVQVLALLEERRGAGLPSLAVVPRSLIFNWKDEAARFTPKLRILDHTGSARQRGTAHFSEYDLVLTTYGTLRRDAATFAQAELDYVILDEAQAIKNASSDTAKCARLLRGRHRLALSGTPVENHIGELWSLFEFLNPGLLGKASAFRLLRANGSTTDDDGTRQLIARAVRPFILRRTKDQVARELPSKLEQTLWCELDATQRRVYDSLRSEYRQSLHAQIEKNGIARAKIHVLEALLRLRQAACDARLLRTGVKSAGAKIETLLPQLDEVLAENHKVLVFSQFTSMLALVRQDLDARGIHYAYLDGKSRDRAAQVERFQTDPALGVFLISLKAGGQGLNLTAADYVFLLDPWWNPAVEAQAIDRAHRIGQRRPVFAYRLVARDTVEEKILELQAGKRALADAILTEDKSLIGRLAAEDIEMLLS